MPTIKEAREAKSLRQADLGALIGLSRGAISRLENGHPIQRSTLLLVCHALGISPENVSGVNVYSRATQAKKKPA